MSTGLMMGHLARMQTLPFTLTFGLKVENFCNLRREMTVETARNVFDLCAL